MSDTNVTNIKASENSKRIEILELMLEKAKAGTLDELFLVGLYSVDGMPMSSEHYRVHTSKYFDMSAAIESALFDRNLHMAKANGAIES